ncbi:MAG: ABC transporter ATP-binding protein [Pseudomonadota bacterium]
MTPIVSVKDLRKVYASGFEALSGVNLDIKEGEVLALLGPNGAGKTTLISTICGITTASGGSITVGGYDTIADYRQARALIGLVPQEINLEPFEKVVNTVSFSRGLFGKKPNPDYIRGMLDTLSLGDKAESKIMELSGGMKRRVLIAKALAHEPRVLFLDEPTAGVDVELRKSMWETVEKLRQDGVTIILTTHYIEEAEAIADRVAVISKGNILLVEDKETLMARMGQKQLRVELTDTLSAIPDALARPGLELSEDGTALTYTYDATGERTGITALLSDMQTAGVKLRDLQTSQSSLEDIFVDLVHEERSA